MTPETQKAPPASPIENPVIRMLHATISVLLVLIAWNHVTGPAWWVLVPLTLGLAAFQHYRLIRSIHGMGKTID